MRILIRATLSAMLWSALSFGGPVTIATANETVTVSLSPTSVFTGQATNITASVNSGTNAGGTFAFTVQDTPIGSVQVAPGQLSASYAYAPSQAGQMTVSVTFTSATQAVLKGTAALYSAAATTTTSVTAPSPARPGAPLDLVAQVSGGRNPSGTVSFTVNGAPAGSAPLQAGTARTTIPAPMAGSPLYVAAMYSGDRSHLPSTGSDAVTLDASAQMNLAVPGTVVAGRQVQVSAGLPGQRTGKVTFTVDGRPIGTVTVTNGHARQSWTPTGAGVVTVAATMKVGDTTITASDQTSISVASNPRLITGTINARPWDDVASLTSGSSFTLDFAALSRSKVTARASGACTLSEGQLTTAPTGGECTISATAPAAGPWPASAEVFYANVALKEQDAPWAMPQTVRAGRPRLLTTAPVTNAGQPVTAEVMSGRCSVKKTSRGLVIRIPRKGTTCTVLFTAPGKPGQWAPFSSSVLFESR